MIRVTVAITHHLVDGPAKHERGFLNTWPIPVTSPLFRKIDSANGP